jgi:hypothetical protein
MKKFFASFWLLVDEKSRKRLKLVAGVLVLLLLVVLSLTTLNQPRQKTDQIVRLALVPQSADLNGLSTSSTFVLQTSQPLDEATIVKQLKFTPSVNFKVQKQSTALKRLADTFLGSANQVQASYLLTPTAPLESGVIYKAQTATDTSIVLDHDYSWAFKVKDDFIITASVPSDKGVAVPVNTGLQIDFSRVDLAADASDYFTVEPAVKGKLQVGIDRLTFVPEAKLNFSTLYTVTLKKGYRAGNGGESLATDTRISFETESAPSYVRPSSLSFSSNYSELTNSRAGFLEANGDATSTKLTVYKYATVEDFFADYNRYEDRSNSWATFNQAIFKPGQTVQELFNFQASLLKRVESDNFGLIKLPKTLDQGLYAFKLDNKAGADWSFARVSPLAYYFTNVNGDGLLWTYDFQKKQPLPGVTASWLYKDGHEEVLGLTDTDGLLKFDSSVKDSTIEERGLIFRGASLTPTIVPNAGNNLQVRQNYFNGYLNLDRYAYRLTDKLHYWGVVKGRSFDLRQKKVIVTLDGSEQKEVMVSNFDTISGEIDFEGLNSGYHNLTVEYNKETVVQASFEVFNFQKPLYKISVVTDKNYYLADQTVKTKIKVNFFDDTPVKNMELAYTINWDKESKGTIKTNDLGEAELSYVPKYYFNESSDAYSESWTTYPQSLSIHVQPARAEEGEIWGEVFANVYGPGITMQAKEADEAGNFTFTAKVNELNLTQKSEEEIIGRPVAGQLVEAKVVKYYYTKIQEGETYDPIENIKTPTYRYEIHSQILRTESGLTNNLGEWLVKVDKKELTSGDGGFIRVYFTAVEVSGKKVRSSAESWADYPGSRNTFLNLSSLDQKNNQQVDYKVGDPVHLEAKLVGADQPLDQRLLLFSFQDHLRTAKIIATSTYTDVFAQDYTPSMSYMMVRMMPFGMLESGQVTANFRSTEKKINVEINTDKAAYRPKDEVKLSVRLTDNNKQAIQATANISAVDEALLNITPWGYGGDILSTFYAPLSVYPSSQFTGYVMNFKTGAEKGGCFVAGTQITMSDGSQKNIEDIRVGDEVETLVNERSTLKVSSIVQGVSAHAVGGYLVINDNLKLTPEHVIYLNDTWQPAGLARLGDYLKNAAGRSEEIKSIDYVKAKETQVYNIIVDHYHTYLANSIYVHNAEKGGGGDSRIFFEDTPLYQEYQSDASGKIETSFKAPDNLTSWHVAVNAFDPQKQQAGSNFKLVPVSLPLFADAVIAPKYLVGDEPLVKLRVFGRDYKLGQTATLTLDSTDLKLHFSTTTTANEIFVPIGKLSLGKFAMTVGATQGELHDSLVKNIVVQNSYVREYKSDQQLVAAGLNTLQKNLGAFTEVVFVDAGKGKYFDQLLSLAGRSSLRSDIETASFLASQLLDKYFYAGQERFASSFDLSSYNQGANENQLLSLFPWGSSDVRVTALLADAAPASFDRYNVVNNLNNRLVAKKSTPLEIAQSLYALAALDNPNLPLTNYLLAHPSTTVEAKVYLALALYEAGDREGASLVYQNDIVTNLAAENGGLYLQIGTNAKANIKATALLGVLISDLMTSSVSSDLTHLETYLAEHPITTDSIELEQSLILRNKLAHANQLEAQFDYQTADRQARVHLVNGTSQTMNFSEKELASLRFSNVSGEPMAISYYEEYVRPTSLAQTPALKISQVYLVNDRETNTFKEGDVVKVRLDVVLPSTPTDASYQVASYLPAGLRAVTVQYSPYYSIDSSCNPNWYPLRQSEDALYYQTGQWFEKTSQCPHRTINYTARVVSRGQFIDQGATIQSLQDLKLINISATKKINVE